MSWPSHSLEKGGELPCKVKCLPTPMSGHRRASKESGTGARTTTPPSEPLLPQNEPSTQLSHTNQPPRKQIPTFSLIKFHHQTALIPLSQVPRICLSLLPLLCFKENCPWGASQKTRWRTGRNYVWISQEGDQSMQEAPDELKVSTSSSALLSWHELPDQGSSHRKVLALSTPRAPSAATPCLFTSGSPEMLELFKQVLPIP